MRKLALVPRFLRPLAVDRKGVSVIEMAFLAPILAAFTVGIADLGRGFAERFALQQSIHRTLEMAHQAGPVDGTYDYLIPEAAGAANVPTQDVTLDQWLECDGVRQAEFDGTCANTQQIARYIELRIDCTYNPMFSGIPFVTRNPDGSVPMSAEASLRIQ